MSVKNNTTIKNVGAPYLERDATGIIKGVALVFMFVHHFFTIPSYYVDGIAYPYLEGFAVMFKEPFKICVAIFAFLTGYFYVFSEKRLRYSLRKSTDVWTSYFVFFLLLLIPAAALGCWDASVKNFVLEAFGIINPTMTFCWYIDFYILSLLLLPLFHMAAKKHIIIAALAGVALPIGVTAAMTGYVHIPNADIEKLVFNFLRWFPCIASGYIFARYELFERCFDVLFKRHIKYKWLRVLIYIILMLITFVGRKYLYNISFNVSIFTFNFSLDFLLAPLFIYGLLNIINAVKHKKLLAPLSIIGKYSMGMWFLHCIFFNTCKEYTQILLFFPRNPILVLIWGLAICLAVSAAVMIPVRWLLKQKNKLFAKQKS